MLQMLKDAIDYYNQPSLLEQKAHRMKELREYVDCQMNQMVADIRKDSKKGSK